MGSNPTPTATSPETSYCISWNFSEPTELAARTHPPIHPPRRAGLTLAWEGDVKDPRQALLWLEDAREAEETETSVEFRNTRNLRRSAGMLEEFVQSVETAAKRGSRDEVNQASAR